ncbi:hypothetical protein ACXIUT_12140 [Achromobacter denitrificans]
MRPPPLWRRSAGRFRSTGPTTIWRQARPAIRFPARCSRRSRSTACETATSFPTLPTGSVSLAFADNCSNGIEPAYGWTYRRRLRLHGDPPTEATVENHAWRLWKRLHPGAPALPGYFRGAADIAPADHVAMLAALQPYVDASISKTVPIPARWRVEDVQALFMQGWRAGLKGLTVFRPDPGLDAVMSPAPASRPPDEPPAQDCRICG